MSAKEIIEEMKDVFDLATTGFEAFYKNASDKDSGSYSTAASSGNGSTAASSGNYSTAASSGADSACAALGYKACVKGDIGNLLMCSEFDKRGKPLGGKADLVDGDIIKPDTWYSVLDGEWIEVDITDGIFSRVISTRNGVKIVKDDNDKTMYIVSSNGFSAHGDTIKEAKESLLFKLADRDTSQYKGMALNTVKTPLEWAVVYSVITGACVAGCRSFMSQKKLKKSYTLSEIIKETEGQYNSQSFKDFFMKGEK